MECVNFSERAVITRPLFRYVYDSCSCVCVYFASGYPDFKNPCGIASGNDSAGVGNQITRARFVRATASQGGGIRICFRGVQKRAYFILAIASQFKGTPNANSRGIDPGHCCPEGDADKQNARNGSGPLHRMHCEHQDKTTGLNRGQRNRMLDAYLQRMDKHYDRTTDSPTNTNRQQ